MMKKTAAVVCGFGLLQLSCGTGIDPNGAFSAVAASCASILAAAPFTGVKQIGSNGVMSPYSGTVAPSNGSLITGHTTGALTGNTMVGTQDGFVISLDAAGSTQWSKQLGAPGKTSYFRGVRATSAGEIYISGFTDGAFDGNTLVGTQDVIMAKFDSSGTKVWSKQFGVATKDAFAQSLAIDSSSNLYAVGSTNGAFGGTGPVGTYDAFVIKVDSSGTLKWTQHLGVATKTTIGYAVAVDSSGNVYATGYTNGTLSGVTPTGTNDAFLAKYDTNGTLLWVKLLGVASVSTLGYSVAVDSANDRIYLTGPTSGALPGATLTGTSDTYVAQYDGSGNRLAILQFGVASSSVAVNQVTVDSSGNPYLTGNTTGALDGNTLVGSKDGYVVKLNSSLTKQWTKQFGGASKDTYALSVAFDCAGQATVLGQTAAGLGGNSTPTNPQAFATKYDINGARL